MRGKTHVVCGTTLLVAVVVAHSHGMDIAGAHITPALGLITVGAGSYAPDIDLQTTHAGQKHKFISKHLTHRGITHTLLVPAILTFAMFWTAQYDMPVVPDLIFGFDVGWLAHIFADLFNRKGVPILWPLTTKKFHVACFVTGTWHESVFIILWIGACIALRYSDVDFEKRVIHLQHNAIVEDGKTVIVSDMKTVAGHRDVPMPDDLYEALVSQPDKSGYIFAMRNGEPMTKSSFRSMFSLIERELPDRHITAHILRHTYITRLFEMGLDLKEIQYLAGHKKVEMTLNVYTHYDLISRSQETANKVISSLKFATDVQQSCDNLLHVVQNGKN